MFVCIYFVYEMHFLIYYIYFQAALFCPKPSATITPFVNSTSLSRSPSVLLTTPLLSSISPTQSIPYSSESRLFLLVKNSSMSNQSSGNDNLVALYVIVPLACILFGFFFGVLTLLHWKKKMSSHNFNTPVFSKLLVTLNLI